MIKHTITNIEGFLKIIFEWKRSNLYPFQSIVFRGESQKFKNPCSSSLSRMLASEGNEKKKYYSESSDLSNWVGWAQHSEGVIYPKDEWELLMQARHHGMINRLTDFTRSPLVALWMACSDALDGKAEKNDGRVFFFPTYLFDHIAIQSGPFDTSETEPGYKVNRSHIAHIRELREHWLFEHMIVAPPVNFHPRLIKQHGVFHICHNPTQGLNINSMHILEIPKETKLEILDCLDICGINSLTLGLDTPDNIAERVNTRVLNEYQKN